MENQKTMESPMQTIINKCKTLMPDETHNSYYILEDLVMAMNEMAISYETSISRGEMGMALFPMKRFFRLRDEFIITVKELVKQ